MRAAVIALFSIRCRRDQMLSTTTTTSSSSSSSSSSAVGRPAVLFHYPHSCVVAQLAERLPRCAPHRERRRPLPGRRRRSAWTAPGASEVGPTAPSLWGGVEKGLWFVT
ncbi:unnamed protein product [Prorocentrum cordatum]|uniref:Uncharacterized protein n=1 Tax=Prorocentrum cordatum TaxID=2364126 RepID=A0ABN9X184_9DINO|nr:unnamed protein product [Polarella glacialis]